MNTDSLGEHDDVREIDETRLGLDDTEKRKLSVCEDVDAWLTDQVALNVRVVG